jgi:hemoglobin
VNHVRGLHGFEPLSLTAVKDAVGDGLSVLLDRTVPVADPRRKEQYLAHHLEHCLDATRPYPGVMDGLERLRGKAAVAVVTNKPQQISEKILAELGMTPFVRGVIGGDTPLGRKPEPRQIQWMLEQIGVGPWHACMIGDSDGDVRAGRNAICGTAHVAWGFRATETLTERPDHVLHAFEDVDALLAWRDGHVRTVFELVGAEKIWELARAFYGRVDGDARIRAMFPRRLDAPIEHQATFFIQFFGGPNDYSKQRGHPRLRMRHAPFPVDRMARDAWVENMFAAMQDVAIPEPAAGVMRRYFEHTGTFLINRE